jgi:hypothetical protein
MPSKPFTWRQIFEEDALCGQLRIILTFSVGLLCMTFTSVADAPFSPELHIIKLPTLLKSLNSNSFSSGEGPEAEGHLKLATSAPHRARN